MSKSILWPKKKKKKKKEKYFKMLSAKFFTQHAKNLTMLHEKRVIKSYANIKVPDHPVHA